MPVDPTLPRTVLVIHGVQLGVDEDQNQNEMIKKNIEGRLGGVPLQFETQMFQYEALNDQAQKKWKKLLILLAPTPVGVIAKKALDIYEAGNPCYLVAHSLGSIYAFDVVNQ